MSNTLAESSSAQEGQWDHAYTLDSGQTQYHELSHTRLWVTLRFPIRRLDLMVGIAYAEDVDRVEKLLLELAEQHVLSLEEPKPFVLITGFGPSSVDIQFSFWVAKGQVLEGRSQMMVAIKQALDREGVEIPFPHTSVYAGSHSQPFRVELLRPQKNSDKEPTDASETI